MQDEVLEGVRNDEVVSDTCEARVGPVDAEGSNGGEHALDVANVVLNKLYLLIIHVIAFNHITLHVGRL